MDEQSFGDVEMLEKLWAVFRHEPFPPGSTAQGLDKRDLVALDAAIAGCVQTFIARGYKLDQRRLATLGICYGDVTALSPRLNGELRDYFVRLEKMALLTLQAVIIHLPPDHKD